MTARNFEEQGVATFAARIDGETIQWDEGLSYAGHLQTERLLSAKFAPQEDPDFSNAAAGAMP